MGVSNGRFEARGYGQVVMNDLNFWALFAVPIVSSQREREEVTHP